MDCNEFRVICEDWSLSEDDKWEKSVIIKRLTSTEEYICPLSDDIVDEDRVIVLKNETKAITPCNIRFEFKPTYNIYATAVITECEMIELFTGKCDEYQQTFHGEILDDFEGMQVYRFDIDFEKYNCSEFSLRFIQKSWMLSIFAILVAMKPNMKALSSSLFPPSINFENVQNILAESKHALTPNAEKCKNFLQSYMNSKALSGPPNMEMLMSAVNGNFGKFSLGVAASNGSDQIDRKDFESRDTNQNDLENKPRTDESDRLKSLTEYVDGRLEEMERRIEKRLDEFEARQSEKLNKILELLISKNSGT